MLPRLEQLERSLADKRFVPGVLFCGLVLEGLEENGGAESYHQTYASRVNAFAAPSSGSRMQLYLTVSRLVCGSHAARFVS